LKTSMFIWRRKPDSKFVRWPDTCHQVSVRTIQWNILKWNILLNQRITKRYKNILTSNIFYVMHHNILEHLKLQHFIKNKELD
jgi:hypothetical protein